MPQLTPKIRRAVDGDRQAIWTVHTRAIRETCSGSYSAAQIAAWAGVLSPDSYVTVLRDRFFVVAEGTDGIVGFGQLDRTTGEVNAVYVLPTRQGEGIGRELLRSLEDAAGVAGLKRLQLSATLNAVAFYEKAGYVREGPAAHRLPTGEELPCVRMSKDLVSSRASSPFAEQERKIHRRDPMGNLEVSARMTVRKGQLEGFKSQAAECIRQTKEKDTKTVRYDWFLSSDQTECEIRETYVDSEGLIEHRMHVGEALDKLFNEFADAHAVSVYGDASSRLVEMGNAQMAGRIRWYSFLRGLGS